MGFHERDRYADRMTIPRSTISTRATWGFAILYSVVVLAIGLAVSVATGEWIALLCASGLVILPIGGMALRAKTRHE